MTDIDRTDIIQYRIDRHVLEDLKIAVATMTLDAWAEFSAEYEGDTRFGWAAPAEWDDQITIAYCPEAVSLVTDTLSDEDFVIFLDTLEWIFDKGVALLARNPEMSETERARIIEDELYEINPEVLRFLSGIQMNFLGAA